MSVSVFEFEVVLLGLHSSRGRALQSRYSREVGDGYGIKARRLEEEFKEKSVIDGGRSDVWYSD